uniref:G_PROTEIN_RECEP_F1_2 domain-containing protein n=1 Tax=Steinernema glaseri TaxID=37863 RepID=A0A1I7ZEH2_9BILA
MVTIPKLCGFEQCTDYWDNLDILDVISRKFVVSRFRDASHFCSSPYRTPPTDDKSNSSIFLPTNRHWIFVRCVGHVAALPKGHVVPHPPSNPPPPWPPPPEVGRKGRVRNSRLLPSDERAAAAQQMTMAEVNASVVATVDATTFDEDECYYMGTDYLHIKIYLIGVFATSIALLSILLNSFFVLVFLLNPSLRRTSLYYFGILALIDVFMAFNYIALMTVPVYMDQFQLLWLYHVFLAYLRPVMTESNCAMFSSMMLILCATLERFLRIISSPNTDKLRRFVASHRPLMCFLCVAIAFLYKLCTFFEIQYVEKEQCAEWSRFEIVPALLAQNATYRFWWMFVTRNMLDRIVPFFVLVALNFIIINGLKEEHRKCSMKAGPMSVENSRGSLKDATRALISVITMYLLSQFLQVFITFWEAFHKQSLELDFQELYSYLNDIMSIMTLITSALHYPVYCVLNRPIYHASVVTLKRFRSCLVRSPDTKTVYRFVGNTPIDPTLRAAGLQTNVSVSLKGSHSDDSTVAMVNVLERGDVTRCDWTL